MRVFFVAFCLALLLLPSVHAASTISRSYNARDECTPYTDRVCNIYVVNYVQAYSGDCVGGSGTPSSPYTSCPVLHKCLNSAWGVAITATISCGSAFSSCRTLPATTNTGCLTKADDTVSISRGSCAYFWAYGGASNGVTSAYATPNGIGVCVDYDGPYFI